MEPFLLRHEIYSSLLALSSDEGITASGKNEIYGCIFGRDTALTVLKILKVLSNSPRDPAIDRDILLSMCRNALLNLVKFQGRENNTESGEEPGKFIHELRRDRYDHLVKLDKPWYIYDDGILRNYDSIDVTPLVLTALFRYWDITHDILFLSEIIPAAEKALHWLIDYADRDGDGLIEYELPPTRRHGGLCVQSWTDSFESLRQADGTFPAYPIAPVEVQGYCWLAYRLWARFSNTKPGQIRLTDPLWTELKVKSEAIKNRFNARFLFTDKGCRFAAQALDGHKNQIRTVTGNPLLLLWASDMENGITDCIVDQEYIPDIIKRSFQPDMFHRGAGIRTMSTESATFNPSRDSYHNGSFWPILNGMIHEGLTVWGYHKEALFLKTASLKPIEFFKTPIELYIADGEDSYQEYMNSTGQTGCRNQAWSAAALLDLLTYSEEMSFNCASPPSMERTETGVATV